jgi:WD40 repeat protein
MSPRRSSNGAAAVAQSTSGYDAFISYSHALDGTLAPTLQSDIERFAKPWYRLRALRVFRDTASLSANPGLWSSIEKALESSRWLLLMASPESASSRWVEREVAWWRANRSADRLLILLTDGDLVWDDSSGDVDWEKTNALPSALRGAFAEEPRWVDLRWLRDADQVAETNPRLRECVADIAAAVRQMPKDMLVGEHIRQHRRTMRLARSSVTALVVLLVATMIGGLVAVNQRDQAREQARIATARQLAATSGALLSTRLDLAQLFAVEAFRMDPSPQTRSAMFQSVTSSPHLVRYLPMGAQVSEVAGSGDGRSVVAGLKDGRVLRWNLAEPKPQVVFALRAPVSSLSVSRDSNAIVAADGADAMLWKSGRPASTLAVPPGETAGAVALSPSGRTATVQGGTSAFEGPNSVVIVDVPTGTTRATHDGPETGTARYSRLVAASDDELLLLDRGHGSWQRRRLSDWALEASSSAQFGVHSLAVGTSSDGTSFTETNGVSTIPVWRTTGPSDYDHPGFTAQAPISSPTSLTLSPDGTRVAVDESGTIYVSPVAPEGGARGDPVQLVGNGSINPDGIRFFGDNSHLLSASGDMVALWNLDQLDRLAQTAATPVQFACNACGGPMVAAAPGAQAVATVDGSGTSAVIQLLDDGSTRPLLGTGSYGPPVWDAGGRHIILPAPGVSGISALSGLPTVRVSVLGEDDDVVAAGRGRDGRTVIVVNSRGQIRVQDVATGAVLKNVPGPPDLAGESPRLATNGGEAAVNSAANLVAVVDNGAVVITDLGAGNAVGRVPGPDAYFVTFSGQRLLVQRTSGSLEVWDQRGSRRERVLSGDESYVWPPVASEQGALVARQRSDRSIVLADSDSGAVLATFPSTSGSIALRTGVAFTPDGSQLITVTEAEPDLGIQGKLVWRNVSDTALVHVACATAGRSLTPAEWHTFAGADPPADLACR